jgi:hypothetical protein
MAAAMLAATPAGAQSVMTSTRFNAGLLDFDRHPNDVPLRCDVTPVRPILDFGFRFQAGYSVNVPMEQFSGSGHRWAILSRLTPAAGGAPVYFGGRSRLPAVPAGYKQQWQVGGLYVLGEGRYHVSWKMVDERGRVCRKEWDVEARLRRSENAVRVALPPNTITDFSLRGVATVPPKDDARPIRLTVFLHAASMNPRRMRLSPRDRGLLLGALSTLLQRVPVRSTRLVVFNLEQQKELYRRDGFEPEELDDVAQTIDALQLGLVDYGVLKNRTGHLGLLADLLRREAGESDPADVVLFLGPLASYSEKLPGGEWAPGPESATRFFYFEYRPPVQMQSVLPDTIQRTVAQLKGKVILIRTPGDLAKGIEQIEGR